MLQSFTYQRSSFQGVSLVNALEAEEFAQKCAAEAHMIAHSIGVAAPPHDAELVHVKRLPHRKVQLFDGLQYSGTYIGEIDENGDPHGFGERIWW